MKRLRDRLRPLTFKGKIEYLMQYYSFHLIGVIVVVFFLVMGIHTFTNQPKEMFAIRVMATDINDGQMLKVENQLNPLFKSSSKKLSIYGINTGEVSGGNQVSVGKIQKLSAEIAAKQVDVLLVDEEAFQQFNKDGNLYDLRKLNGFKEPKDKLFRSDKKPSKITGFDVSDIPYFSPIAATNKPLILAVVGNSEKINEIQQFVKVITKEKM